MGRIFIVADTPTPSGHGFDRLQQLLLNLGDINEFLTSLAQIATETVAAPASCGMTMRYHHSLLTVGSSDARAELLDETQYRLGDGPCLESLATGTIVSCPDVATEQRWPEYMAAAAEMGLRCSLSLPLTLAGHTFGAMNVYGFDHPHLFGEPEQRQLELFAAQAAGTLRVGSRHLKDAALMTQMEQALQSRTVIDQAMGIIMAQQRCTAEVAFDLLRRESQNRSTRLRDVATALVTRTSGEPPTTGRPFEA